MKNKNFNESIINKVVKLLNRTKDNPFEEEAKVCMLKAQKLMAEHNISMQEVATDALDRKEVISSPATARTKTIWWHRNLGSIIAENFRCYCYLCRYQDVNNWRASVSQLIFLGFKEDVELALQVFKFAVAAINYNSKDFVRRYKFTGKPTKGIKNAYIQGFLVGLQDQFLEQVNKNDWGLVLVKDAEVIEAYKKLNCEKSEPSSKTVANSTQAKMAGYKDGQKFKATSGELEE